VCGRSFSAFHRRNRPDKTGKNQQKQANLQEKPTKSSNNCGKRGFCLDFALLKAAM
jgi:hypothetical protein